VIEQLVATRLPLIGQQCDGFLIRSTSNNVVGFSRRQILGLAIGLGLGTAALPLRARKRSILRVGLISDLNSSYGSTSYVPSVHQGLRQLIGLQPDLVVCAGDMVAGQKRGLTNGQLDAMWAGFNASVLRPLQAARIPLLPTVGNHDGSPDFPADREAVRRFWNPLRPQMGLAFVDASQFPFRYSVQNHGVFWLVWDSSSATISDEDVSWARQQLTSAAAMSSEARFVVGHLPLLGISQGKDRPGEILRRWNKLQTLMENADVKAYISGHHHAWFSSRWGQLDLIQLGAMGSGPRRLLQGGPQPQQTFAVLEIDRQENSLTETNYVVSTGQPQPWGSTPKSLVTSRGRLQRNLPTRPLKP